MAIKSKIKMLAYGCPIPRDWNDFREPEWRNDNFITDEQYKYMQECGITGCIALWEKREEDTQLALGLAEKYGLEYWVRDQINWDVLWDPTIFEREKDRYLNYLNFKSFAGIFITDEPDTSLYPNIRALKDAFEKVYGKMYNGFYTNLLPTYANDVTQLGAPYPEYIQQYIDVVDPDHVSFDHYPFEIAEKTKGMKDYYDYTRKDYFYNDAVVADACDKAGKEMWTFIESKNYCGRQTDIDYDAFKFQYYVHLAYGSKAIIHYTYWTWPGYAPGDELKPQKMAIMTQFGEKTEKYYYCQEIQKNIHEFGDIIADCKRKETYISWNNEEEVYFKKVAVKPSKNFNSSAPLLVGEFTTKEGKNAYVIVNATDPYDKISNRVKSDLKGTYYVDENKISSNGLDIELKPGQGIFVVED